MERITSAFSAVHARATSSSSLPRVGNATHFPPLFFGSNRESHLSESSEECTPSPPLLFPLPPRPVESSTNAKFPLESAPCFSLDGAVNEAGNDNSDGFLPPSIPEEVISRASSPLDFDPGMRTSWTDWVGGNSALRKTIYSGERFTNGGATEAFYGTRGVLASESVDLQRDRAKTPLGARTRCSHHHSRQWSQNSPFRNGLQNSYGRNTHTPPSPARYGSSHRNKQPRGLAHGSPRSILRSGHACATSRPTLSDKRSYSLTLSSDLPFRPSPSGLRSELCRQQACPVPSANSPYKTTRSAPPSPGRPFANLCPSSAASAPGTGVERNSAGALNKRSTNFSYPRCYSDLSNSRKQNTAFGGSTEFWRRASSPGPLMYGFGEDGQNDGYDVPAQVRVFKDTNPTELDRNSVMSFTKLHGGVPPNLTEPLPNEHISVSRNSSRHSQMPPHPNYSYFPDEHPVSLSRRASYRNFTDLSSVSNEQRIGIYPTASYELPNLSRTSGAGLDTEGFSSILSQSGDGTLSVPAPPSGGFEARQFVAAGVERRRVDDFEYVTTLDAAIRPYTPDRFTTEALTGLNTRNPSGKSKRSGSILGGRSRRSQSSTRSAYTATQSLKGGRNVLRKQNPNLMRKDSWDACDGEKEDSSPARSPIGGMSLGIFGGFLGHRTLTDEPEFSTEVPHTATTNAGPARGIIMEESPGFSVGSDVSQNKPTSLKLERLNSLARQGREKYDAVARDIRQLLALKNEENKQRNSRMAPENITRSELHGGCGLNMDTRSRNHSRIHSATTSLTGKTIRTDSPHASETIRVQSPTSSSGFLYVSTSRAASKVWGKGIGGVYNDMKGKRDLERSLRYGPAGKKVKVYMKGAKVGSVTALDNVGRKARVVTKFSEWEKAGIDWIKKVRRGSTSVVEPGSRGGDCGNLAGIMMDENQNISGQIVRRHTSDGSVVGGREDTEMAGICATSKQEVSTAENVGEEQYEAFKPTQPSINGTNEKKTGGGRLISRVRAGAFELAKGLKRHSGTKTELKRKEGL